MSKEIINYKESFITKIKKFFKKLFYVKENKQENTGEKINNIKRDDFRENIRIKQDEEELKIKNLQKEYKAGNINEEEMTDDEHEKLIDLYKKQNKELKDKIETKKQIIRKKLDGLKES